MIVTLNLAIGQQTPPVASVLLVACSIAKRRAVGRDQGQHLGFIGVLVGGAVLVTYVPWLSLVMINVFYGG